MSAAPATAPAAPARRRTGLLVVVCVLVAAVTVAASALGTRLLLTGGGGTDATADCGVDVSVRCLRGVRTEAVVASLRARGFVCDRNSRCELKAGMRSYALSVGEVDGGGGHVTSLYLVVQTLDTHGVPKGPGVAARTRAVLSWASVVPFSQEPQLASAATAWSLKRLDAGRHEVATINQVRYDLDASRPDYVTLSIRGEMG
jgi:hypothetical protein